MRSEPCSSCLNTARIQVTMRSVFVDFNNLYANSLNDSNILRQFEDGLLRMGPDNMLPTLGKSETAQCGARWRKHYPEDDQINCYQGGDTYANNNAQKITLITLFAREHNRLARELKKVNPDWSDEVIRTSKKLDSLIGSLI